MTVGDDRVRAKHRILDGMRLAKNDPRWNTLYPPNGWACRCQVIEIFDKGEAQPPPPTMEINGLTVTPGADKGFRFHPGKLFGAMEAPRIA